MKSKLPDLLTCIALGFSFHASIVAEGWWRTLAYFVFGLSLSVLIDIRARAIVSKHNTSKE